MSRGLIFMNPMNPLPDSEFFKISHNRSRFFPRSTSCHSRSLSPQYMRRRSIDAMEIPSNCIHVQESIGKGNIKSCIRMISCTRASQMQFNLWDFLLIDLRGVSGIYPRCLYKREHPMRYCVTWPSATFMKYIQRDWKCWLLLESIDTLSYTKGPLLFVQ